MLTDVKTWLETTGMEAEETAYKSPPSLPYLIFLEEDNTSGADDKNCIINRSISVELYSQKVDYAAEQKIRNLLDSRAITYKRSCIWLESERFFQTVYDFELIEKI